MKNILLLIFLFVLNVSNAQSLLKQSDDDWDSQSLLQSFIDLQPYGKQIYVYEDRLNIKPININTNSITKTKTFYYQVKSCNFSVYTDTDGNVSGYTLYLNKNCPFKIPEPLNFDSQTSTLKKILSHGNDNCHNYIFTTNFFDTSQCGQICDYNLNEIISEPFARMCGIEYERIIFGFHSNKGIEMWRDKVIELNSTKIPYKVDGDKIISKFKNGEFDSLANKLWDDKLPNYLRVYFYTFRFTHSEERRHLYGQ